RRRIFSASPQSQKSQRLGACAIRCPWRSVPADRYPTLALTGAHLEHVVLGTRPAAARAEALDAGVPNQLAWAQLVDGPFRNFGFHAHLYVRAPHGAGNHVATRRTNRCDDPRCERDIVRSRKYSMR